MNQEETLFAHHNMLLVVDALCELGALVLNEKMRSIIEQETRNDVQPAEEIRAHFEGLEDGK